MLIVTPGSTGSRGRDNRGIQPDRWNFFESFAKLDPEYEELISDSLHLLATFPENTVQISTSTIKSMRLITGFERGWPSHQRRTDETISGTRQITLLSTNTNKKGQSD